MIKVTVALIALTGVRGGDPPVRVAEFETLTICEAAKGKLEQVFPRALVCIEGVLK